MRKFKDKAGREWRLALNVATVRSLRHELGVDLLSDDQGAIRDLAGDPIALCEALWALIAGQAEEAGVSQLDFWEAMSDDSIDQATTAFLEALVDFFPTTRQAAPRRVLQAIKKANATIASHLSEICESGKLDTAIDAEVEQTIAGVDQAIEEAIKGPTTTSEATAAAATPGD